jgi:putative salt-induced outer membrane protein
VLKPIPSIAVLLMALLPGAALAQDAVPGEDAPAEVEAEAPKKEASEVDAEVKVRPGEWSGNAGAGFLATDGNAQSRSMNGKVEVEFTKKRWKNSFQASAVNTSSGDAGTSAERYLASDKVDYQFFAHNYAFVVAEYEKDLFGATRERTSQALGLGRHVLAGPEHFLDLEAGGGLRQTEDQATGAQREEGIARGSAKYEWKFTEKNAVSQNLKVESGASNTFTESVSALKLAIIGNLSSSLSYTVRHNSEVQPDREHTDAEAAVNLVYDFGKE